MFRIKILISFFLLLILTQSIFGDRYPVFLSRDLQPYKEALEGLKEGLGEDSIDVFLMEQKNMNVIKEVIKKGNYPVIISIGTEATIFAQGNFPTKQIIFTMVLSEAFKKDNSSGVVLKLPWKDQLEKCKRYLPNRTNIGIIYSETRNKENISQITEAAKELELSIVTEKVTSYKNVPRALDSLSGFVDIIWLIPDSSVYNIQTREYILKFSREHKIPLMGLSSHTVEKGSLIAFEADYRRVGLKTAELVESLKSDTGAKDIPVEFPEHIKTYMNEGLLEVYNLNFDEETLKEIILIK